MPPTTHPSTTRYPVPVWYRVVSRIRGLAAGAGPWLILVGLLGGSALPAAWFPDRLAFGLGLAGFGLIVLGVGLALTPYRPSLSRRPVGTPVHGRWRAQNSPTTRVPSHGTHGFGQTYGIDLIYEPEPGARPVFGAGRGFRPPTDFPAFGEPVYACADGEVLAVRDRGRDHASRASWLAYAYMMAEGSLRELAGTRAVLGNHVVLDIGAGQYAAYAHLRRGSVLLRPGDRVYRGQIIAECGNSGNTSEPHLHFQLMDRRRPALAAGVPFEFVDARVDGEIAVPGDDQIMDVGGPA
jgi:murein DD-endopeptidase MepM/ murein hydrolase activator NlpD